jgi:hypothetical protein
VGQGQMLCVKRCKMGRRQWCDMIGPGACKRGTGTLGIET